MINKIELLKMLMKKNDWKLIIPFGDARLTRLVHKSGVYFYANTCAVTFRDERDAPISDGIFSWLLIVMPALILELRLTHTKQT